MANETGKDLYINIPSNASLTYITDLADLFAYGSDGVNPYTSPQASPVWAPLNSNLKVYIEFSNEIWNGVHPGRHGRQRLDQPAFAAGGLRLPDNNQNDSLYPGVVGVVGYDYDIDALTRLGIDHEGIRMAPANKTTKFICRYSENMRDREIIEERDASALAIPRDMPERYLNQAQHFHVATMPPHQQEEMIKYIRSKRTDAKISVDTINFFITERLKEVIRVLELADTVFLDRRRICAGRRKVRAQGQPHNKVRSTWRQIYPGQYLRKNCGSQNCSCRGQDRGGRYACRRIHGPSGK